MKEDFFGLILRWGNHELKLPAEIVYSLIIMIVISIVGIIIGNKFRKADYRQPQGKFLSVIDTSIESFWNFLEGSIGKENSKWIPFVMTMFIYLLVCNTAGYFGIRPPATNINFTASFAAIVFVLTHMIGLKKMKWRYFGKFTGPVPGIGFKIFLTPIEILSHIARPLSLTMRLFGNILAGTVIIELVTESLKYFSFILLTPIFNPYFDLFDGVLQSFVFILLTTIYFKEATETH